MDALAYAVGCLAGLPRSAARKAAVRSAEEPLAGEWLALDLHGDDASTRRFLVGVSGNGVISSFAPMPSNDVKATTRCFDGVVTGVDIFRVVAHSFMAAFTGDFDGEVGVTSDGRSGCEDIEA